MAGPSPHLSWEELGCRDGTPYPAEWRATRAPVVARTFERIRTRLGELTGRLRSIPIGSGYRTPAHNASVGGAKDSMHLHGLAIDLRAPAGVSVEQLLQAATDTMTAARGGIFVYPWGIHVDRRDYLKRPPARGDFRPGAAGGSET